MKTKTISETRVRNAEWTLLQLIGVDVLFLCVGVRKGVIESWSSSSVVRKLFTRVWASVLRDFGE